MDFVVSSDSPYYNDHGLSKAINTSKQKTNNISSCIYWHSFHLALTCRILLQILLAALIKSKLMFTCSFMATLLIWLAYRLDVIMYTTSAILLLWALTAQTSKTTPEGTTNNAITIITPSQWIAYQFARYCNVRTNGDEHPQDIPHNLACRVVFKLGMYGQMGILVGSWMSWIFATTLLLFDSTSSTKVIWTWTNMGTPFLCLACSWAMTYLYDYWMISLDEQEAAAAAAAAGMDVIVYQHQPVHNDDEDKEEEEEEFGAFDVETTTAIRIMIV